MGKVLLKCTTLNNEGMRGKLGFSRLAGRSECVLWRARQPNPRDLAQGWLKRFPVLMEHVELVFLNFHSRASLYRRAAWLGFVPR